MIIKLNYQHINVHQLNQDMTWEKNAKNLEIFLMCCICICFWSDAWQRIVLTQTSFEVLFYLGSKLKHLIQVLVSLSLASHQIITCLLRLFYRILTLILHKQKHYLKVKAIKYAACLSQPFFLSLFLFILVNNLFSCKNLRG